MKNVKNRILKIWEKASYKSKQQLEEEIVSYLRDGESLKPLLLPYTEIMPENGARRWLCDSRGLHPVASAMAEAMLLIHQQGHCVDPEEQAGIAAAAARLLPRLLDSGNLDGAWM